MSNITIFHVLQACDDSAKQHRKFRHAEHFPDRRVPYPTKDTLATLIETTGATVAEAEEALGLACEKGLISLSPRPGWRLTDRGQGYWFVLTAPTEELDGLLEMRELASG